MAIKSVVEKKMATKTRHAFGAIILKEKGKWSL